MRNGKSLHPDILDAITSVDSLLPLATQMDTEMDAFYGKEIKEHKISESFSLLIIAKEYTKQIKN